MTLNFGHRGASGYFPENTMLAFEQAIEMHCDGIETDVQLTKDGVAVLCHDERIDRTANAMGFICNYTYQELLEFDFGVKFGADFIGEKIPTLDALLALAKAKKIYVNLELKNSLIAYKGLEKLVIDTADAYQIQDQVIISSFNHYSVMQCKAWKRNLKLGFLYDNQLYKPGQYGKNAGITAMHPNYRTLNAEVIQNIKNAGLAINTYTVNATADMEQCIAQGIDMIITNYPEHLHQILTGE